MSTVDHPRWKPKPAEHFGHFAIIKLTTDEQLDLGEPTCTIRVRHVHEVKKLNSTFIGRIVHDSRHFEVVSHDGQSSWHIVGEYTEWSRTA